MSPSTVYELNIPQFKSYMRTAGHDDRSEEELIYLRDSALDALDFMIGDNEFVCGTDKPTRADATLLGLTSALAVAPE